MNLPFLSSKALPTPHGFFTREGGVSRGPYFSLNANPSSNDDPSDVAENRARIAKVLGVAPHHLISAHQVHGRNVAMIREPNFSGALETADGLVTDQVGVALGIITADCAPVLLIDDGARVIGAAHAGWRGALAGILEATVEAMTALNASPECIQASIGPCIQKGSYEVGQDLRTAVLSRNPDDTRFFSEGRHPDRWQFDLPLYAAARLSACGVSRVEIVPADTVSDSQRFFSYRRQTLAGGGPVGHQLSAIRLSE